MPTAQFAGQSCPAHCRPLAYYPLSYRLEPWLSVICLTLLAALLGQRLRIPAAARRLLLPAAFVSSIVGSVAAWVMCRGAADAHEAPCTAYVRRSGFFCPGCPAAETVYEVCPAAEGGPTD